MIREEYLDVLLTPTALRRGIRTFPMPVIWAILFVTTLLWNAYGRTTFPFWPDEAYTVLQVRAHDWRELLRINLNNEETPPLYFVVLRLWSQVWGDSGEGSLRLFSACCLAGSVAAVGWLGQRLCSRQVGLWAALLLATNPLAHFFGQETRSYAFALLLTSLTLVAALHYVQRPHWHTWLAYVGGGTTALYTNYFAGFTLLSAAGIGWAWLYTQRRRPGQRSTHPLLGWLGAHVALALLLVPWLPGMAFQYRMLGDVWAAPIPLATLVFRVGWRALKSLVALGVGLSTSGALSWTTRVLLGAVGIVSLVQTLRYSRGRLWPWGVAGLLLPLLAIALVFRNTNYYHHRYTLLLLPGYVLFVAASLVEAQPWARWTRPLLVALMVVSVCYSLTTPLIEHRGGWDRVARVVEQQAQPSDGLFFAPPWTGPAFRVQYKGQSLAHGIETFAQYHGAAVPPTTIDTLALTTCLARTGRAWVVWDRATLPHLPHLPGSPHVKEQRFGTTSLLLVTTQAGHDTPRR